jgi:hypothetical protein
MSVEGPVQTFRTVQTHWIHEPSRGEGSHVQHGQGIRGLGAMACGAEVCCVCVYVQMFILKQASVCSFTARVGRSKTKRGYEH